MKPSAKLPDLQPLLAPTVHVAGYQQRLTKEQWSPPFGFERYFKYGVCADRTLQRKLVKTVPHARAVPWFHELYSAYLCANAVHSCKALTDVPRLFDSESAELQAAAQKLPLPDDSLPPRSFAVWVCVYDIPCVTEFAVAVLDGTAHWSRTKADEHSTLASCVRLTILNACCANEMRLRLGMSTATVVDEARWGIVLRWADRSTGRSQFAARDFNVSVESPTGFLAILQQSVLRLCSEYNAPLPAVIASPVVTTVPPYAFAIAECAAAADFARLATPAPQVAMSGEANLPTAPPLESLQIPVRLIPRQCGNELSNTHFHGVLLGFAEHVCDIHNFVTACLKHEADGKCIFASPEATRMGIHICAVNTTEVFLRNTVSLYSPRGRPGKPIHAWHTAPHGGWMWAEYIAIRPLDADMTNVFAVHPCTPKSVWPATEALVPTAKLQFARASALVVSVQMGVVDHNDTTIVYPLSTAGSLLPMENSEGQARTEFFTSDSWQSWQLDLSSRRTQIGEALHFLLSHVDQNHRVHDPRINMLLAAAGIIGVEASVSHAMEYATSAMRSHEELRIQHTRLLQFVHSLKKNVQDSVHGSLSATNAEENR